MNKITKTERATSGFFWRFFERCGAQGVTFVVSIILARLLDPAVYGSIALVTVFTTILQVFVDSGLGNALIQKKEVDDLDYSSVFYFNIIVCAFLYAVMFFFAVPIANFYGQNDLISVIRVISLTLVISGVKNIQQAYVSRNMLFRKFFFATLAGTISAAAIGIYMAYKGFGVWALVVQNLVNLAIDTLMLWFLVDWRPILGFSYNRLKVLLKFGNKVLLSKLIETIYNDVRQLVIGKMYSSEVLAYYNRGQQYSSVFISNINVSLDSVLLPLLSSEQDSKNRVRELTRVTIQFSSFIMMPLMVGLAVCAEPIVRLTLTDKWIDTVFYVRIFCFNYAFYAINTTNINGYKALGRSDIVLKTEIIKKTIGIIALILTIPISVKAIAFSLIVTTIATTIINAIANKQILGYAYKLQILDIASSMIFSVLMGIISYGVFLFNLNDICTLILQVVVGIFVYVFFALVTKNKNLSRISNILRKII